MSMLTKSTKPKAIRTKMQNLKKIMCMDKQIWSRSIKITFVEGGMSTTVEYEEGATVNRFTTISGYTFVGWSKYSDGRDPVVSFVATEDATYYRVLRSNDIKIVSNVTAKGSIYVIPVNMSYDLSGYSRLRLVMDVAYTNQNRGPYDIIRLIVGGMVYTLVNLLGNPIYSIDKTIDISSQYGVKNIRIECSFEHDDSDVDVTANVKEIVLYP